MARFYLDNDVAAKVAVLLRARGHDAISARDLKREDASDDEQFFIASELERVFITHNEKDFILLYDAWKRWSAAWQISKPHPGAVSVALQRFKRTTCTWPGQSR